jgi:hypothetical protein
MAILLLGGFCACSGTIAIHADPGPVPCKPAEPKAKGPPLLLIDVSAALVNKLVGQPINRTEGFRDVIKETPVTGLRKTVGEVHAELVPDPEHGVIDIVFSGSSSSQDVGHRHFTKVYTTTAAGFEATYRVVVDAHGFRGACGPAGAKALICLVDVIDHNGDRDGIAQWIRRGFREDKEELESIVSTKTRVQTSWRLAAELEPVLDNANQIIKLAWLKRAGVDVEGAQFCTTPTHLHAQVGLAAPAKGPLKAAPAVAPDADFSVRVNSALLNGMARNTLGGKTLRLSEARTLAEEVMTPLLRDGRKEADRRAAAKALDQLLADETTQDSTLTLAAGDPLGTTFDGGTFKAEIHLSAARLGGVDVPGQRIQAVYRAESGSGGEGGVNLVRQGPVEVIPDDPKAGPVAAAARALLKGITGELLVERLNVADLPGSSGATATGVTLGDGWLSGTWKLKQ